MLSLSAVRCAFCGGKGEKGEGFAIGKQMSFGYLYFFFVFLLLGLLFKTYIFCFLGFFCWVVRVLSRILGFWASGGTFPPKKKNEIFTSA